MEVGGGGVGLRVLNDGRVFFGGEMVMGIVRKGVGFFVLVLVRLWVCVDGR